MTNISNKIGLKSFLAIALVFVFYIVANNKIKFSVRDESKSEFSVRHVVTTENKDFDTNKNLIEMSIILKNKMRDLGQLSCNLIVGDVSVNGGWCRNINSVQHVTDGKLVTYLSEFLKGKPDDKYFQMD